MSVANVVSMEFESEQALQEFAEKYKAFGPMHYPQAEIKMFIKTDQQSGLGISIYPNEEASEAGRSAKKSGFTIYGNGTFDEGDI